MNKTININLGGIFFHIDETAYKKLKKYLDAIRKSLSDDPKGKDEILADIESRIGEILAESVKDVRQVVNQQDIDDIIIVMGKPEDYIGDEEFFDEQTTASYTNKKSKKLYRDMSDKFLGGVSSGLAHYFGFDVIWVRLAWLILAFGAGIGFPVYIVLWILLPEAHSTAEKLEMEGEPVNITNIEKKIRAEFTNASQIVKDGIDDVQEHIKNTNYQSKVKTGSQEIVSLFGRIFSVFFGVFGKFIGILLLAVAGITLIALAISAFSVGSVQMLGFGNDSFVQYPPFFYNSSIPFWLLTIFLFVGLIIPFVVLFMLGLKILSKNTKSFNRITNLSLLGIWLIALFGIIFSGIEYGTKFNREKTVIQKNILNNNKIKTLTIKMTQKDYDELNKIFGLKTIVVNDVEKIYSRKIKLDIQDSNTDKTYIKILKKANGVNNNKATDFAKRIDYNYQLTNNNLILDGYFLTDLENKFQNQSIKIIVYLAKNTKVFLDKSTKKYLHYVDNVQEIRDCNMINHYFKMTPKGLNCLDCKDDNIESESIEMINKEDTISKETSMILKTDTIKTKKAIKKTEKTKIISKHVKEGSNGLEIN